MDSRQGSFEPEAEWRGSWKLEGHGGHAHPPAELNG